MSGLLRCRGGTEPTALAGIPAGSAFALLNDAPVPLDPVTLGDGTTIAALGLADPAPVAAPLIAQGLTLRPLTPVHGTARELADGSLALGWCRRSRGSWLWQDGIEVPLNEQQEAYLVGIGNVDAPNLRWDVGTPQLAIDAATWTSIRSTHSGKPLWVRQVGTAALSPPLLLITIA